MTKIIHQQIGARGHSPTLILLILSISRILSWPWSLLCRSTAKLLLLERKSATGKWSSDVGSRKFSSGFLEVLSRVVFKACSLSVGTVACTHKANKAANLKWLLYHPLRSSSGQDLRNHASLHSGKGHRKNTKWPCMHCPCSSTIDEPLFRQIEWSPSLAVLTSQIYGQCTAIKRERVDNSDHSTIYKAVSSFLHSLWTCMTIIIVHHFLWSTVYSIKGFAKLQEKKLISLLQFVNLLINHFLLIERWLLLNIFTWSLSTKSPATQVIECKRWEVKVTQRSSIRSSIYFTQLAWGQTGHRSIYQIHWLETGLVSVFRSNSSLKKISTKN